MEGMLAEIRMHAGNFAPRGWVYCEGQLLSITANTALFSLLGTAYGGDGTINFALPDLRGRTAIGTGQGTGLANIQKGTVVGSNTVTLQVANLPAHNHAITGSVTPQASTDGPLGTDGTGRHLGPGLHFTYDIELAAMAPIAATGLSSEITGNGDAVSIMQSSLGVYYIICVEGAFPEQ